jgi:hypothetical protein
VRKLSFGNEPIIPDRDPPDAKAPTQTGAFFTPTEFREDIKNDAHNVIGERIERRWRSHQQYGRLFLHVEVTTRVKDREQHTDLLTGACFKTSDSITEWKMNAIVPYSDIAARCDTIHDTDECRQPWDDCDGYEHDNYNPTAYQRLTNCPDEYLDQAIERQRGAYRDGNNRIGILLLPNEEPLEYEGIYDYHRARGASKQVAYELAADAVRNTKDQLLKWYRDGWDWYGVTCEISHGFDRFEASCWGYQGEEHADEEGRDHIISEIIHYMEDKGYRIVGVPDEKDRSESYKASRRYHHKRMLNIFNRREYHE